MSDAELIDQIEMIRARNNSRWMDLIRLAMRVAPVEAKAILREIHALDGEVRRLTAELAR